MTVVVYEKKINKAINHVTKNGERTICKKKCSTWPYEVKEGTPTVHCTRCWSRFS